MRFVKVAVRNFQAIESAEIAFAPGLNVVFGPNDLGKSTLASAIRAALLVPPSSTEARRYIPWSVDAVPEVTLTFQGDDDRFWRVRKSFGAAASQSTADLYHSKDGSSFTREHGGRDVEGEIRKLLAWGVPSPGGKGAPRKLPTSFLSQVLLPEQTDVDTIFEQSLEGDGAASGKERLQKALAALAEDPRFKKIFTEVQRKVTEYFSATGRRKQGRDSPFAIASEEIKRRADRIEQLRKEALESESTEETLARLRDACSSARVAHDEATMALQAVRLQQVRASERTRAEAEHSAATAAVVALQRQADGILEQERAVAELEAQVLRVEDEVADARRAVETANATLSAAEKALRLANSEEGTRQRELARAKLDAERAEVTSQLIQAQNRLEALVVAKAAEDAAKAAIVASTEARAATEQAIANERVGRTAFTEVEKRLEFARGLLAYGHWQEARSAGERGQDAKLKAEALSTEARAKEQQAQDLDTQANEKLAAVKAPRAILPDPAFTTRLEELERELAIAEAALGGGFSLVVRGSGKAPVHVSLDGDEAIAGTELNGRFVFEATRSAALRFGDLLDVEVFAGATEKRHAVEALRERWAHEALPILDRAGVSRLSHIREHLREVAELEATAENLQRESKRLRAEAEATAQSAEALEQRAAELLVRAAEADTYESRFASLDKALLAAKHGQLGSAWKQEAEALVSAEERDLSLTRDRLAEATRAREHLTYRADELTKRAAAAQAEISRVRTDLGLAEADAGVDPLINAVLAIEAEIATLSSRQTSIERERLVLDEHDTSAVAAAQGALDAARAANERAANEQAQKTRALEEARSKRDTARGQLTALRNAFENADRAGVDARVTASGAELKRYATDSAMSPDAVRTAERRESEARAAFEQLRRELDQAEGALTRVGGDPLKEELRREEEALGLAKQEQHALELDADSWKLLRDTLERVEKEGSSHLGRSLAATVGTRLVELTHARYGALRLDQHLKVEAVEIPSLPTVDNVLEALSVGTRNQVATLVRLTIAEQLKSAIILDDHLVHTDPERLGWFRTALREAAQNTQVIVITCRPEDYLEQGEVPCDAGTPDREIGGVRAIDFGRLSKRFEFPAPGAPA